MARFLNLVHSTDVGYINSRLVRELGSWLIWTDGVYREEMPPGFQSDGASVPRLPLIYDAWGDKAHREAFGHDFGYRKDSILLIVKSEEINLDYPNSPIPECYILAKKSIEKIDADWFFRQTMKDHQTMKNGELVNTYGWGTYQPMYWAVRTMGSSSYHRMNVMDKFEEMEKEI